MFLEMESPKMNLNFCWVVLVWRSRMHMAVAVKIEMIEMISE